MQVDVEYNHGVTMKMKKPIDKKSQYLGIWYVIIFEIAN